MPPTRTNLTAAADPRPAMNSSPNDATVGNGIRIAGSISSGGSDTGHDVLMYRDYPSGIWPIGVAKTPSPTAMMAAGGGGALNDPTQTQYYRTGATPSQHNSLVAAPGKANPIATIIDVDARVSAQTQMNLTSMQAQAARQHPQTALSTQVTHASRGSPARSPVQMLETERTMLLPNSNERPGASVKLAEEQNEEVERSSMNSEMVEERGASNGASSSVETVQVGAEVEEQASPQKKKSPLQEKLEKTDTKDLSFSPMD